MSSHYFLITAHDYEMNDTIGVSEAKDIEEAVKEMTLMSKRIQEKENVTN